MEVSCSDASEPSLDAFRDLQDDLDGLAISVVISVGDLEGAVEGGDGTVAEKCREVNEIGGRGGRDWALAHRQVVYRVVDDADEVGDAGIGDLDLQVCLRRRSSKELELAGEGADGRTESMGYGRDEGEVGAVVL